MGGGDHISNNYDDCDGKNQYIKVGFKVILVCFD